MQLSFPTSASLAAFPFKPRHVGFDVYDKQAQLAYVCISAGTGLAALSELTGSGGGSSFTAARYYGYSTNAVQWFSNTWRGVTDTNAGSTPLTLTDVDQTGITRSGSTWTFTDEGDYVIDFKTLGTGATTVKTMGVRIRQGGSTVRKFLQTINNAAQTMLPILHCCLTVSAGGTITIEYATSAQFLSYGGATIDSEVMPTSNIEMYRVK